MKKTAKIIGLVMMLSILVGSNSNAQHHQREGKPSKEKKAEVKAYVEQNILPVAITKRNELETILSSSEKDKIASLRARQEKLHQDRKEKGKSFNEGKRGPDKERPVLTDAQHAEMRAVKKERRLIMTEVFEIVDAHEDFFNTMEADLKDDQEGWRTALKGIMGEGESEGEEKEMGRRHGNRGRHGGGFRAANMLKPTAFVLLDPLNPPLTEEGPDEVSIFPNPASKTQTISLDLKVPGTVMVELIDSDGKVYDRLYKGNLEKGMNSIEVNVSELKGKQYFYKITTPSGSEVKRTLLKD